MITGGLSPPSAMGLAQVYPNPSHDIDCVDWFVAEDYNPSTGNWLGRVGAFLGVQGTAGKRPTHTTIQTTPWVNFDGTDDDIYIDGVTASGILTTVPTTVLMLIVTGTPGATSHLWSAGDGTDADNARQLRYISAGSGTLRTVWGDRAGGSTTYDHQLADQINFHTIALVDEGPTAASVSNDTTAASNHWSAIECTRTDGQTDPGAGANAVLMTDTAANTLHVLALGIQDSAAGPVMVDCWLKPGTLGWVGFRLDSDPTGGLIYADLTNGVAGSSVGEMSATVLETIGFWRKWRFTGVSAGGASAVFRMATADDVSVYSGGTGTIFIGTGATYGPVCRQAGRRTVYLDGVGHTADPRANHIRGDALTTFTLGANRRFGAEGDYGNFQLKELSIHERAFSPHDVRIFGAGMRARSRLSAVA